jgi:hypothetical protein
MSKRPGNRRVPVADRFWPNVDQTADCWLWRGAVGYDGYGRTSDLQRRMMAHRVAYEMLVGPIPAGLVLDHLCRVRHCVNPAHLEPVTQRENIRRGAGLAARNASKTHCPRNHPYDEANTAYRQGYRHCRACERDRGARRRLLRRLDGWTA